MNKKTKSAIAISQTTSAMQFMFGIPLVIISSMFCVFAIGDFFDPEEEKGIMIGLLVFFGLLDFCGVKLILSSKKRKYMLREFRKYVGIMSVAHTGSFDYIAEKTKESSQLVQKNIDWMVDKNFFYNGRINLVDGCLDMPGLTEEIEHPAMTNTYKAITCKFCGATSKIEEGKVTPCPYCSSPLQG